MRVITGLALWMVDWLLRLGLEPSRSVCCDPSPELPRRCGSGEWTHHAICYGSVLWTLVTSLLCYLLKLIRTARCDPSLELPRRSSSCGGHIIQFITGSALWIGGLVDVPWTRAKRRRVLWPLTGAASLMQLW